jgi:hypothetical protein
MGRVDRGMIFLMLYKSMSWLYPYSRWIEFASFLALRIFLPMASAAKQGLAVGRIKMGVQRCRMDVYFLVDTLGRIAILFGSWLVQHGCF